MIIKVLKGSLSINKISIYCVNLACYNLSIFTEEIMKKIIVLLISVLLLAGCSAKKEVSCVYTEDGYESTIVFVGEEDEVHSSKETVKLIYEFFDASEVGDKDQIKEQIESSYAGIDGVKVSANISGEEYLVITMEIDYEKISKEDLESFGVSSSGPISFENMISDYESYGYTCTVK